MVSRVPGYGQFLSLWSLDIHVDLNTLFNQLDLVNDYYFGIELEEPSQYFQQTL